MQTEQIEPTRLRSYASIAAAIRKVQRRLDDLRRDLDATTPPERKRRRGRPRKALAPAAPVVAAPKAAALPAQPKPARVPFRIGQSAP
jgi:hypothetical protein